MSRSPQLPRWSKQVLLILVVAALYVVTARLGLTLALPPERKATAVWPPSGIALAAVLLAGRRVWPGIWLGAFAANIWDFFAPGNPFPLAAHLWVSSSIATGSTLQPLLGAFLLRRWIGERSPLDRAQSVFQFVGVALLMCLVASTVGVTALCRAGFAPWAKFGFDWWTWWLGDTVGVFIVTPLILVWSKPPVFGGEPRRLAEAGLLLLVVVGLGLWVLGGMGPWGNASSLLAYMTVPPLIWATYRFAQRGATTSLLLTSGFAVWGAAHNHGPFVRETLNTSLILLQTFVGVLTVTALALAGVLTERRRAEVTQANLVEKLQRAAKEIRVNELLEEQIHWIARELHDEAGQLLASVHLALHEVARSLAPATKERLLEIRALLDQIELQLRRLSHELRPTILDDLGLMPALEFLSEGVSQRAGLAVTVDGSTNGRLPPPIEMAIYRIVQEALNNVARHAAASRVWITLLQGRDQVHCSIRDDGVGFRTGGEAGAGRVRGLGLTGIRERIAALAGSLEIQSDHGKGTLILVSIPLESVHA
jgi:signal transduction histidine kinase